MLMSLRSYAKRRGVSPMAVSLAVKSGRLSKSVARDENNQPKISDPELADQEWQTNTDYSDAPLCAGASETSAATDVAPSADLPDDLTVSSAAARQKHWQAKLAEQKFQVAAKQLLDASEVKREWTDILSQTRTKLLSVPTMLKQAIPHLTTDDVLLVEKIVRDALQDLVDNG